MRRQVSIRTDLTPAASADCSTYELALHVKDESLITCVAQCHIMCSPVPRVEVTPVLNGKKQQRELAGPLRLSHKHASALFQLVDAQHTMIASLDYCICSQQILLLAGWSAGQAIHEYDVFVVLTPTVSYGLPFCLD
eukprot:4026863-Amphidinium_carterae.1